MTLEGKPGEKTLVKLRYPFGEASATWNTEVNREGDIVSVAIPWVVAYDVLQKAF
jgi:hypothetical protein